MSETRVRLLMAVLISVVLLGAGLYILLSKNSNSDLQKAATGWIGVIIGYWLK
jgi:predicted transporter